MQARYWVALFGIVYIVVGILGFLPGLRTAPPASAPHLSAATGYGYLFGQFPVNVVHDVVNIVLGVFALLTFPRLRAAEGYSRFLFLIFGIAAFIGFVPAADTLGGILPIFGADTWADAVTAILAAYFGWVAHESTQVAPAAAHAH